MNRFVDLMFQGSSGDAPSHWVNNKRALIDCYASAAMHRQPYHLSLAQLSSE